MEYSKDLSAGFQESTTTNSTGSESTPLTKKNYACRTLLHRLQESVLIKSKAANMILIWSILMHLLYGLALHPDNIFTIPVDLLLSSWKVTIDSTVFINTVRSGVYGVIAIWLLFYPLAGYMADIRYGRYKAVLFGIRTMWTGSAAFIFAGGCISAVYWTINSILAAMDYSVSSVFYLVFFGGVCIFTYIAWSVGYAAFAANVIRFGIDQLQDLPTRDSFLFIHWFLLTQYIGVSIGKVAWSTASVDLLVTMIYATIAGCVLLLLLCGTPVTLCVAKPRWFNKDLGVGNPYREVVEVVRFARRHKIPIRRSAFTYWEDNIPTGLDLGKRKYGGPFTTEQVENVKSFFGIFCILLSLGPWFTVDIAASAFLPVLKHHMMHADCSNITFAECIVNLIFANGGTLHPILIVILIPIFLKIIHPLLQRYIPAILKRIGIGLCLTTISLLCSLLVDTIGHALPSGQNATSIFDPGHLIKKTDNNTHNSTNTYYEFVDASPLNLSPHILIIQSFLAAIAYILIYGGVFEFICAQSPHSMKGVLIGILYAVKGLFQLIGVLGILFPFGFWTESDRVGLVYFMVNIVISVGGIVAFAVAARKYQYRQREEIFEGRRYIEEYYEKSSDVYTQQIQNSHSNFSANFVSSEFDEKSYKYITYI